MYIFLLMILICYSSQADSPFYQKSLVNKMFAQHSITYNKHKDVALEVEWVKWVMH